MWEADTSSPGRAAHRAVLCLFILSPQLNPRPRAFLVTVSRQQRGGEEPPAFSLSTPGNNRHSRLCVSNQFRNARNVWAGFHRRVLSGSLGSHTALTTPTLLFIHYSCKSVPPFFFCLSVFSQTFCWPNWTVGATGIASSAKA